MDARGDAYTPEQQRAGQRTMLNEGLFSRAMEALISGVILAGFAIALGATDFEIGLISSIPFLAHLIHLPAVGILARTLDRRRLAVRAATVARLMLFAIALIPLVNLPLRPVHALIPLLIVYALLANLAGAVWQVWVRDLVPRREFGSFFGRRMAWMSAVGLFMTLGAGFFVTFWRGQFPEQPNLAFGILFAAGAVLGLIGAAILNRAPMVHATLVPVDLGRALRRPLADANFRRVLVFLGAWGFAANFSLPFVTVVLIKTLGYSLGIAVLFAALSTAANVASLTLWAPVTDRFGNKPVLALGASVFVVAIGAWAIMPKVPGAGVLLMAGVVHILLGLAAGALDLASNGLVMKLAPDDDVPAYLSTASVAKSVATGVAPLVGGLVAALLADRAFFVRLGWSGMSGESTVTALRFAHYDFLFLISAILGLYAIHRLLGFVEEGEAPPVKVVRALRRDLGQVSSIAGMRQFSHMASYIVEAAYRFERTLDVRRTIDIDDDDEGEEP